MLGLSKKRSLSDKLVNYLLQVEAFDKLRGRTSAEIIRDIGCRDSSCSRLLAKLKKQGTVTRRGKSWYLKGITNVSGFNPPLKGQENG